MSGIVPAAAATCVRALPEDVFIEILARVPDVVSLFRCAVVCKRWRSLVSDPAFLRRRPWPEGGGSALIWFFVQPQERTLDDRGNISDFVLTDGSILVPAPCWTLGPGRRLLTSFVRDDAGVLDHAKLLAARDGLLLVSLPPSWKKSSALQLCVCNLLTGRRDLLPPLATISLFHGGVGRSVGGYAVLSATDHGAGLHRPADGYFTFFQVLLTGIRQETHTRYVFVAKFSSDCALSKTWSYISGGLVGPCVSRVAEVTRGTPPWLFISAGPGGWRLHTLNASISTGLISAPELNIHGMSTFNLLDRSKAGMFTSIDGRLSYFCLNDDQLCIWSRPDGDQGGTEAWHLTQSIMVDTELGLSRSESLYTVCIAEKSSTILTLSDLDLDHPYVLHLRLRSTTMLEGWNQSFNHVTAVPYEMN